MERIVIVGCGQLGSRHLQAVVRSAGDLEVWACDPRPEALAAARARLEEVPDRNPSVRVLWAGEVGALPEGCGLCIVATRAEGRCALVEDLARGRGYRRFLVEKLVAQEMASYDRLVDYARREGLTIWVNCKARAYGINRLIRERLDPSEPLVMQVAGRGHGLASNGVHAADLFCFFDGGREIRPVGADIDPRPVPSKRGGGLYDLQGMLCGVTEKGSRFVLSYLAGPPGPEHFTILSPTVSFFVDSMRSLAWEASADGDGGWRPIVIDEDRRVSRMTTDFVEGILSGKGCALPTLEEARPAHRFILDSLQPHFRHLLGREEAACPVT